MLGSVSAQVGLLAFAAAIVAGLYAGNAPATVLLRALAAMLVGFLVGRLASGTIRLVLRDHLQRRKLAIDQSHAPSTEAPEHSKRGDASQPTEAG
jgi:hypothetical protein